MDRPLRSIADGYENLNCLKFYDIFAKPFIVERFTDLNQSNKEEKQVLKPLISY
jgi:hypothetical protein